MNITYTSAVLWVKDVAVSRRFYETVLGQTVDMDFGANVGFKGGFAIWQAAHAAETIFADAERVGTEAVLGHDNVELYFECAAIEDVVALLAEYGVPEVHPLREQPWGQRVIRVYDPDRHIVEVGEPMPAVVQRLLAAGESVDAVVQRTMMPLPLVQYMAEHGELPPVG